MDLLGLQAAIQRDDTFVSPHALSEALADGLSIDEIWSSIQEPTAEVVEDYPTDPHGPSCLVLSFVQGRPVHTCIAYPAKRYAARRRVQSVAFMITVYRPDLRPSEWSADFRIRLPHP